METGTGSGSRSRHWHGHKLQHINGACCRRVVGMGSNAQYTPGNACVHMEAHTLSTKVTSDPSSYNVKIAATCPR